MENIQFPDALSIIMFPRTFQFPCSIVLASCVIPCMDDAAVGFDVPSTPTAAFQHTDLPSHRYFASSPRMAHNATAETPGPDYYHAHYVIHALLGLSLPSQMHILTALFLCPYPFLLFVSPQSSGSKSPVNAPVLYDFFLALPASHHSIC